MITPFRRPRPREQRPDHEEHRHRRPEQHRASATSPSRFQCLPRQRRVSGYPAQSPAKASTVIRASHTESGPRFNSGTAHHHQLVAATSFRCGRFQERFAFSVPGERSDQQGRPRGSPASPAKIFCSGPRLTVLHALWPGYGRLRNKQVIRPLSRARDARVIIIHVVPAQAGTQCTRRTGVCFEARGAHEFSTSSRSRPFPFSSQRTGTRPAACPRRLIRYKGGRIQKLAAARTLCPLAGLVRGRSVAFSGSRRGRTLAPHPGCAGWNGRRSA